MIDQTDIIDILARGIRSRDDQKKLNYLYQTILPKIEAYVRKNGGSKEEGEDLFQDAVITMVKRIQQKKFNKDHDIDGFLYSVAKNLWIDKMRRHGTELKFQDHVLAKSKNYDHSEDKLISKEKGIAFEQVFNQLGEKCRELLKHAVFEKISMKEISVKLGFKNEQVAKAANYRCKKELAKLVKEDKVLIELYA